LLVKNIYVLTRPFPKEEIFGLTNQMRRAAVSIPSNIAEGCGRGTDKQTAQFLNIAQGSSAELEAQVMLAQDLGFINLEQQEKIISDINEIQKMMRAFKAKLNT
jgi:four helix bundle protein